MSYNIGNQIVGVTSRQKHVIWGKIVGIDDINYILEPGGILSQSDNFINNKKEALNRRTIPVKKDKLETVEFLMDDQFIIIIF